MAGQFHTPKGNKEEISLVLEATLRATQYNIKWGRKVLEEWQQPRQNKCEDVQNMTISVEHMSPNTLLYFWLIKFVCEVPIKMESVIRPIRFIC